MTLATFSTFRTSEGRVLLEAQNEYTTKLAQLLREYLPRELTDKSKDYLCAFEGILGCLNEMVLLGPSVH